MADAFDLVAARRRELEQRLARLSADNRAAVERAWESGEAIALNASGSTSGIAPVPRDGPLPMSFAQELLWMMEQSNPGHSYNVPRVTRIRGVIDRPALQRALDALIARHEILRTTYAVVDGEPRQRIGSPRAVDIEVMSLLDLAADEREAAALREVKRLSRRPFDLARDFQLRVTLLQLDADDHVLLLESHHVASDAWSGNILIRELGALYSASRSGVEAVLPPLPVQYADFAAWQRSRLTGKRLEDLVGYWRTQLADAPALLELPTDRQRPRTPSFDGAQVSIVVPTAVLDGLRRLSQAHNATLFMTLLSAVDLLLARFSGQEDIVVGSPIAGRTMDEIGGVMGYFVNMLVLRVSLAGDPTFSELLGRVRETVLGAYDHQELPFEKLVMELSREKVIGGGSPFQVMFTLQDPERDGLRLDGATPSGFGAARGATKFDLSLFALERADGLRLLAEYRTDLFDAATIERMLNGLQLLLETIVVDPQARIATIPLVDLPERQRLLGLGESPQTDPPPSRSLGELLTEQAAATPSAVAVEIDDANGNPILLSYGELGARAGSLAARLRRMGVGPGVGVAICAERSFELVVAIVAVLRSGGYYIPLDPEYPADRVAFMFADAAPRVLLITGPLLESFASVLNLAESTLPTAVIRLDDPDESSERDDELGTASGPEDLAYVIYTSGSTGRPKGVMIPNRAVVNYVSWMQAEYPVSSADAVLQKAPASFDACIWEFFLPLTTGARLVLARPGGHQDPFYLIESIARHRLTILQLVPSQLAMMLEASEAAAATALARMRHLFLGGEALPSELLTRLRALCPDLDVTNLYGPTETTVYSTHWSCPTGPWISDEVPIGRPIANTRIVVVDNRLGLVPTGVAGELCIAGRGVARGYLNREELTRDRFVPDPFDPSGAALMYRTGDRARWRADGTLQYLGRLDTQVKLRGFRIELGEIEQALVQGAEVQAAIVMVRTDSPGDQRLVAYCLPEGNSSPGADQQQTASITVRERLRRVLPAYMVPSAIIWLQAWPLNANGKLNRAALPAPRAEDLTGGAAYRPPSTPTEQLLIGLVEEMLQSSSVGLDDNFFELGGHSLLAMRVLTRVADRAGVRIGLRAFFDAATLGDLAATIDRDAAEVSRVATPRLRAAAREGFRRRYPAGEA